MTDQEQKAFDLMREALEQALRGISAAIFGTDTYKVSSRGDFVSKVEKQIQEALTAANAVSAEPKVKLIPTAEEMGTPVQPQAQGEAIPLEGSEAADNAIHAMLCERQWPSSSMNAARAGWRAARLFAHPQATEPAPTTPEAAGYVMSAAPGRRCTYDNRVTMARECWEDGRLVFSVSSEMLWDVQNHGHPIVKRLHDFLPILQRGWRGGKIQGDSKALQQSTEPAPKE